MGTKQLFLDDQSQFNNWVRYNPDTELYSFRFVASDNLNDFTCAEKDEYMRQLDSWEFDDPDDNYLHLLFEDAKHWGRIQRDVT